jgi:crotonobetaine/carnitine-CoA ligase
MEMTIKAHPAILEVAVHAVRAKTGDDDVKVTAVLRPDHSLSESALFHWIVERVPYFAIPRYVEFRRELPKNPQDKVLKFKLREEGKTDDTWDLEQTDIKIVKR